MLIPSLACLLTAWILLRVDLWSWLTPAPGHESFYFTLLRDVPFLPCFIVHGALHLLILGVVARNSFIGFFTMIGFVILCLFPLFGGVPFFFMLATITLIDTMLHLAETYSISTDGWIGPASLLLTAASVVGIGRAHGIFLHSRALSMCAGNAAVPTRPAYVLAGIGAMVAVIATIVIGGNILPRAQSFLLERHLPSVALQDVTGPMLLACAAICLPMDLMAARASERPLPPLPLDVPQKRDRRVGRRQQ